jgi:hypothetical protein
MAQDRIARRLEELGGLPLVVDACTVAIRHPDEDVRRGGAWLLDHLVWRQGMAWLMEEDKDGTLAEERRMLHAALSIAAADPSREVRVYAEGGLRKLEDPHYGHG